MASETPLGAEIERYAEEYYPAFKEGHRLMDGGIGDQPSRYLKLIGVFRDVEQQVEAQLIAKAKEQMSPRE